jgi:late competence protein required for DNA uptake (superfamily II DNA/RNA helicase)
MLNAMRARFTQAIQHLVIDEIDAVGDRANKVQHNAGYQMQVINGFLVEMDRLPVPGTTCDSLLYGELAMQDQLCKNEPPRLYRRAKLSENCLLWNRHTTRRPQSRIHPSPDSALKMHEKVSSANVRCGWRWNTMMSIVAKLLYSQRLQAN